MHSIYKHQNEINIGIENSGMVHYFLSHRLHNNIYLHLNLEIFPLSLITSSSHNKHFLRKVGYGLLIESKTPVNQMINSDNIIKKFTV